MPLIKPETKEAPLSVKIDSQILEDLKLYSTLTQSSPSHVVTEALKRLFAADRDFKTYKDQQSKKRSEALATSPRPGSKSEAVKA